MVAQMKQFWVGFLGVLTISVLTVSSADAATTLHSGMSLKPGHSLVAGAASLKMQSNGRLALIYSPLKAKTPHARVAKPVGKHCRTSRCKALRPRVVWQSKKKAPGAALHVNKNGNVVVQKGHRVLWQTNTGNHPGATLQLLDSGKFVVSGGSGYLTRAVGDFFWESTTSIPSFIGSQLASGQSLQANQFMQSPNGAYELDMNTNGVGTVWVQGQGPCPMYYMPAIQQVDDAAGNGIPYYGWVNQPVAGSYLTMQTDGNLVLYSPSRTVIWSSDTPNNSGGTLAMQNDGNLVIYNSSGDAIWSTSTNIIRGAALCPGEIMTQGQVLRSWQWQQPSNKTSGWQLNFASYKSNGVELDVIGINTSGNMVGNPAGHLFTDKDAPLTGAFLSMQNDGNLVAYPAGGGTSGTALWSTNTDNNPGAFANLFIVGGALGVFSPLSYSTETNEYTTSALWKSNKSAGETGYNNKALMGPANVGFGSLG